MNLYLIKRGPRPAYHNAPFHPVIICTRLDIARNEAGNSAAGAWIWERGSALDNGHGWLLTRWNGLDINYGVVHNFTLPDGAHAAFWRDYEAWPEGVQDLLPGAVWWSRKKMPAWLEQRGVIHVPDTFSRTTVVDAELDNGLYGALRRDEWPAWWIEEDAPDA
jgi:hypothetical protein